MIQVTLDSVVAAAEQQVSAPLGDETVILHMSDGVYYGLDPVGTRIWSLLQQPRVVGEIRDRIVEEYDVEPERCRADLVDLLQQLVDHRLVRLVSAEHVVS